MGKQMEKSRNKIALYLGVDPETIYFTSGGCEANTWALSGRTTKDYDYSVSSEIEHDSIRKNPDINVRLDATRDGKIYIDEFRYSNQILEEMR